METWGWIIAGVAGIAGAVAGAFFARQRGAQERQQKLVDAQKLFQRLREQLEAKFVDKASASGKPRGLRWGDVDFERDATFARDKQSGRLSAFVGVTIKYEAIAGGGLDEVEAVANAKAATAVFNFEPPARWTTDGRAIFNLNPAEAIKHFEATIELVAFST